MQSLAGRPLDQLHVGHVFIKGRRGGKGLADNQQLWLASALSSLLREAYPPTSPVCPTLLVTALPQGTGNTPLLLSVSHQVKLHKHRRGVHPVYTCISTLWHLVGA